MEKSEKVDRSRVDPELIRKWGQIFDFLNAGNAGRPLTPGVFKKIDGNFVPDKNIPMEKVKQAAKMFQNMWKTCHGDKLSVTREAFIDDNCRHQLYTAGTMARGVIGLAKGIFHSVDFNDDGHIDMAEFMIFSKATGFKNEESIRQAFRAIDVNGDGEISEEEYVDAFIKYDMDAVVKMEDLPIFGLP